MGVGPRWKLLVAGCLLMMVGGALAHAIQTAGRIVIRDVRIPMTGGGRLAGLLYVPPNATAETPAPGVLAIHGYINSRETQSGFAIELSRRGYVVLALDQTGHGFSDGRTREDGYGGPDGLAWLGEQPMVDPERIGLEGHSMGGWASLAAAAAHPDAYRSVTLVGSATGPGFAPPGDPSFPRNLGVVFSTYDEFSQLMWGVDKARDVTGSDKLKAVFGTTDDVVPGRVYGSIEEGTARWLATPGTTHPGDHLSRAAIGAAVEWIRMTLGLTSGAGAMLGTDDQIWPWKEIGTLLALIGGVLLMFGAFDLLTSLPWLQRTAAPAVGAVARAGPAWGLTLAATSLVPALTYVPLTGWGSDLLPATPVLPQAITNQILVWALGNGLIAGAALLVRWAWRRRVGGAPETVMGVDGRDEPVDRADSRAAATPGPSRRPWASARGMLAALLSVGVLYVAVLASQALFVTDLRFWVVALKPMAGHHLQAFVAYVIPFTLFFWVTHRALHRTLSLRGAGVVAQYAIGLAASAGGFAVLVGALYAHLFLAGRLPTFGGVGALFTVIAIQFVAVLSLTGVAAVFTWRRTGGAWAGAVMCGVLVTWYVVAGQAMHV